MRLFLLLVPLLAGLSVAEVYCPEKPRHEPTLVVPEVGTELAQWEDYARLSWTGTSSIRVIGRQTTRDGSQIDLEESYCDSGVVRHRIWEVTRDWRDGFAALGFLQTVRPHDKVGLLLVIDKPIDRTELLRCEAACRQFDIRFRTVDQWGKFR